MRVARLSFAAFLILFTVLLVCGDALSQRGRGGGGRRGVEPPESAWISIESEHYVMRSTTSKENAQKLLDHMELVYKTYCALLAFDYDHEWDRKFRIKLYKDFEEYKAAGSPEGSGAYYSPNDKLLVGWFNNEMMYSLMAHEGMHQFTDIVVPGYMKGVQSGKIPMWYSEGIADCIGNSEAKRGKLYMCIMDGVIARMRIPIVQDAIERGEHIPLSKLLYMSQRDFMDPSRVSLCYAESWAFSHFLMTYPKDEHKGKQIPNGKFKFMIVSLHNALAAGKSRDQAYAEAFRIGDDPIPISELEKLWIKYVKDLPHPLKDAPFLGVEPNLEEMPEKGVMIGRTLEGGSAARAGLQGGDVIIKFKKKDIGSWNDLVEQIRACKPNQSVKCTYIRDGKEKTITIKMKKRRDVMD
jgi:hypothetical protein